MGRARFFFYMCIGKAEVRWKRSTREEATHVCSMKQTHAAIHGINNVLKTLVRCCDHQLMYALAGPVVWYGPVQRDSVTEVRIVAVFLSQVFRVALLSR